MKTIYGIDPARNNDNDFAYVVIRKGNKIIRMQRYADMSWFQKLLLRFKILILTNLREKNEYRIYDIFKCVFYLYFYSCSTFCILRI